ncbi:MAG: M4 family metallopeptidase [Ruminococcus sp.]|nr:M4 family metallopeptidase [Ruminococcus sp.]
MNKNITKRAAAIIAAAMTAVSGVPSLISSAADAWTDDFKKDFTGYPKLCEDVIPNIKFSITIGADDKDTAYKDYYYDPGRNIMVNKTESGMPVRSKSAIAVRSDLDDSYVQAHQKDFDLMMMNTAKVHDNFEKLGYTGFSLMGDPNIYLDLYSGREFNAANNAVSLNGVLRFGPGDGTDFFSLARGYDVVAHEYTHMVTQHKLGWDTYSTEKETAAIMEAYSDIMAELTDSIPNWKIGTDVSIANYKNKNETECIRNIADPSLTASQRIGGGGAKHYSDYSSYLKDIDSVQPGQGSTVISHAAYLMYNSGKISKDDLAQLWYTSIDMYKDMPIDPKKATFPDVKTALTKANKKLFNGNSTYQNVIDSAFRGVGITGTATYDRMTDPTKQQRMDWFISGASRGYTTGSHWQYNHYDSGLVLSSDPYAPQEPHCNHAAGQFYCGSVSVSAMTGRDFKKFDYYSEEPYSQCAGFARLMQIKYFNTTKFVRLESPGLYTPKVGDHIRYETLLGSEHSIFVTSVEPKGFDEFAITYADCNGGSTDCEVNWYKEATLYCDYNGLYFNLREPITRTDKKSYISWIERPIQIGDCNCDSEVNELDFAVISNLYYYPEHYNDPSYDIELRNAVCDINGDGKVDLDDFDELRAIRTQRYNTFFKTHGYLK